jgi:hypothetical protein
MAALRNPKGTAMAKFQYTLSEDDADRAYVRVDDIFDVHLLRTEEGLIVDVWEHERELLGTLAIENPSEEQ